MAAISEKDANIALLELSSSKKKKTQDEVALLKREKDRLVQQLKQQVQSRRKAKKRHRIEQENVIRGKEKKMSVKYKQGKMIDK